MPLGAGITAASSYSNQGSAVRCGISPHFLRHRMTKPRGKNQYLNTRQCDNSHLQ